MDFTEIFKCDGLAAVLASAAVTVAAIAIANLTFALFDGARWGIIRCFNVGAPGAIERMRSRCNIIWHLSLIEANPDSKCSIRGGQIWPPRKF